MFEPISLGVCLSYAAMIPYVRSGSAVSLEAQRVTRATIALKVRQEASQSLFGRKALAISHLRAAFQEALDAHHADSGEKAPIFEAVLKAENFLRALPDDVPMPEFSIEPDGAIALDWIQSRMRMLSVSITERERMAYAWLDGADRGHAVVGFRNQAVPSQILSLIRSIIADGVPILRAA